MSSEDTIRVYVGTDRSQLLAVPVLEHSIKRHTTAKVEVIPMLDLPVPVPKDPRNGQRTGFSFSRFCIPMLAGYQGKAIYMDADMLVFRDISELWNIPFDGAKVVIQQEVKYEDVTTRKVGAPKQRKKQCAVMLLDCDQLDWDIEDIVAGMDRGEYDYEQLMHDLCILDESEVKYGVPFEWNSLEHWDSETRLIHYTDVSTQPWTECGNKFGYLWFDEVRLMLAERKLTEADIQNEIDLGYFRPSLLRDIKYRHRIPSFLHVWWDRMNAATDKASGYIKHKAVYEAKKVRLKAIAEYEARNKQNPISGPDAQKKPPLAPEGVEVFARGNPFARNVLVFTEHVNATYTISFDIPLRHLNSCGSINFAAVSQKGVELAGNKCWERWGREFRPDVVIMTRYGQADGPEIMAFFQNEGIPVVYHIDDDLLELPVSLGKEIRKRHGKVVETRRQLLATCDLIYASTSYLAEVLRKRFPTQPIHHGGIYASYMGEALRIIRSVTKPRPVIGYMGSKGHQHDLQLVVPALERLLDERPELEFEVFGSIAMPDELLRFGERVRHHPVQTSYKKFLASLTALGWSIGLAPLVDEPFNRCKAPTKFIQYTAAGIPTMASFSPVYGEVIPDSAGYLIREQDWYAGLCSWLDDPQARREALNRAQAHCEQEFSLARLTEQVAHVLDLASETRKGMQVAKVSLSDPST
jgi:glycosyltransferase involved in cell wall biosynthesis